MSEVVRNRLILVAALLVAGGALAYVALGTLGDNLVYYWTPGQMIEQGEKAYGATVRLGGVVKPGSLEWNAEHTSLKFRVADGRADSSPNVMVHATQIPPQMFREGIGVVVEGTFDKSQTFTSDRLMVNHSNEYRAPGSDGGMTVEEYWNKTVSKAQPETM